MNSVMPCFKLIKIWEHGRCHPVTDFMFELELMLQLAVWIWQNTFTDLTASYKKNIDQWPNIVLIMIIVTIEVTLQYI